MKFSFWPFNRRQKRFDLEAALANAETLPPGQPLMLEGNPSAADVQALQQRINQRHADLPKEAEPVVTYRDPFTLVQDWKLPPNASVSAAPAPAKPKPTPKAPVPPRRPSPQKRPARRSK